MTDTPPPNDNDPKTDATDAEPETSGKYAKSYFADVWQDIIHAFMTLTILAGPLGLKYSDPNAIAWRGYPIIGALIGLISAMAFFFAFLIGLSNFACAVIAVAMPVLISGARHEQEVSQFMRHMLRRGEKRTDIESYGPTFTTMTLAILLKIALIESLWIEEIGEFNVAMALVAAATLSRTAMIGCAYLLEGTGDDASKPANIGDHLIEAGLICGVVVFLTLNISVAIASILAAIICVGGLIFWAQNRPKLHRAWVFGTAQQISELLVLVAIVAV